MKILALFLVCAAALPAADDYTLGPDSQPHPGVPKGTVTKHTLAPGKFYPGTPHNYSVYVPAQYDAARPAPFMIFLDGSGVLGNSVRVPIVFDNLIAKHDLPPLIGIFVDPGVLPAANPQAQSRYERIFEYDNLSDNFSHFLLEELIPAVAANYNLSKNPDDHAISGVSTGAVGAFMAAWNRPDQFHRVLSFIGTFVAMKGADSLPALIRKTEPKPIRVFLQDGRNDHIVPAEPFGTFYAGSWPINNEVMYEAFELAGYDVKLVIGDEGHNMKQGAAIMPDALRWLWRDYPNPVTVHEPAAMSQPGWDPRGKVYSTVWAAKGWEQVGGSYTGLSNAASGQGRQRVFRRCPPHLQVGCGRQGDRVQGGRRGGWPWRPVRMAGCMPRSRRASGSFPTVRAATKRLWRKTWRPARWPSPPRPACISSTGPTSRSGMSARKASCARCTVGKAWPRLPPWRFRRTRPC